MAWIDGVMITGSLVPVHTRIIPVPPAQKGIILAIPFRTGLGSDLLPVLSVPALAPRSGVISNDDIKHGPPIASPLCFPRRCRHCGSFTSGPVVNVHLGLYERRVGSGPRVTSPPAVSQTWECSFRMFFSFLPALSWRVSVLGAWRRPTGARVAGTRSSARNWNLG